MIRSWSHIILVLLATAISGQGAASTLPHPGQARILVTIADSALGSATRVNVSKPGYQRGSSTYLVSLGVKRAAKRIARDFDLETLDEWPIVSIGVHCAVFAVPVTTDLDDLLARLRQDPDVDSAQALNEFEVSARDGATSSNSYAGLQHSLDTLELAQAHQWSKGSRTKISIIDTGVDTNHPDLKASISGHHDFVDPQTEELPFDAHGTAVAGIIGADADNGIGIIGVAPASRLYILKACWHRPQRPSAVCDSFTLAKALDHAIGSSTDIINLSLTGPSDDLLSRLVNRALADGIVVIAAAPEQPGSGFPSEIEGVIVVESSEQSVTGNGQSSPQIRAPGADILVPAPAGGYDYASGTSLSAAHVSGIAALLISSHPRLTSDEVRRLLIRSQADDPGSVNACRALAELLSESGCRAGQLASRND